MDQIIGNLAAAADPSSVSALIVRTIHAGSDVYSADCRSMDAAPDRDTHI